MFLYALTILVSAFLLFQVEPIIAKMILPWFGGSAAVWTVCLLFFQLVLLAGLVLGIRRVRGAMRGYPVPVAPLRGEAGRGIRARCASAGAAGAGDVGPAARLRFDPAAGGDQPSFPGRGRNPVPVGAAAEP